MPQISVRHKIVEHAERVFREQGFDGASVQDITTAAGVPKGSFYNHFASKQALAAEIVHQYAAGAEPPELSGRGPALVRLREHLEAQVSRTTKAGVDYGCLLGTFAADTPRAGTEVRAAVREELLTWTARVTTLVEQAQATGEATATVPAATLAAFVIDSFEGWILRARVLGDIGDLQARLDLILGAISR